MLDLEGLVAKGYNPENKYEFSSFDYAEDFPKLKPKSPKLVPEKAPKLNYGRKIKL